MPRPRRLAVLQQLDLDEHELAAADIDDTMRDAARPVAGLAGDEPGVARPVGLNETQRSRSQWRADAMGRPEAISLRGLKSPQEFSL